MEKGDVIHLKGIKAEYRLFGKKTYSQCILPDGDYIVLGIEDGFVNLAWSDTQGNPSRKHRYRVAESELS